MKYLSILFIYILLITGQYGLAQSLVEDANLSINPSGSDNLFTETIKIISGSKKIFIITNNNEQLGPGDFISLALDNNLAARAIVAKTHQGQVGIKIIKIYSVAQWGRLKREQEVQIIKGDDSFFGKATGPAVEESTISKIRNEDDLYTGDITVEDDLGTFNENKNRHIKPDNILAVSGAFLDTPEIESRGGTVRANELGVSWAFQFADNYFIEGLYGRALFEGFPVDGQRTLANHLTARLKYNFKGPLYTFFMPYVGYHTYNVVSPDAGKINPSTADEEVEAVDKLRKSGPVFGVTVLRRLVPGWFVKADIGTDIMNVGFAIEF